MTREQASEKVLDYAYGDLSPEEAAAFEAILKDDPALQAEVDQVMALRRAAASLPKPALPPAMRADLLRAARAETRRRATVRRWEEWRAFFLSPVFLAASAVIAAVGVGVHLITLHGTDDPWTRMDREQRMAALEAPAPSPAAPPTAQPVEMPPADGVPAPEGAKVAAQAEATVSAARDTAMAVLSRSKDPPKAEAGPAPRPVAKADADLDRVQAPGAGAGKAQGSASPGVATGLLGGAGRGGGGLSDLGAAPGPVARNEAPARKAAPAPAASAPAPRPERRGNRDRGTVDFSDETIEADLVRPDDSYTDTRRSAAGFAAPPPAAAPAEPSPAPAAAPALVATAEEKAGAKKEAQAESRIQDPVILLERARLDRADGNLSAALDLYRKYLATGPVGARLADALAEAAEVARALGLDAEAEGYLARLERLPGGTDRAARLRAK